MKILLEPSYVLHTRPHGETSVITELFTRDHGRISAMAKNARGPRSRFKGCLMPFSCLTISCQGRSELLQLTAVESQASVLFLSGSLLFAGLYLNELLVKLLRRSDPYPSLFVLYQETLLALQQYPRRQQITLRYFEQRLLQALGYGIQLTHQGSGEAICPDDYYAFSLNQGLFPHTPSSSSMQVFKGSHLIAMAQHDYSEPATLASARQLMRLVITTLLEGRSLKTRELY